MLALIDSKLGQRIPVCLGAPLTDRQQRFCPGQHDQAAIVNTTGRACPTPRRAHGSGTVANTWPNGMRAGPIVGKMT